MIDRPTLRPVRLASIGHLADGSVSLGFTGDDGAAVKLRLSSADTRLLSEALPRYVLTPAATDTGTAQAEPEPAA